MGTTKDDMINKVYWPTTSAGSASGGQGIGLCGGSGNRKKLQKIMGEDITHKLNPDWVETLMGLPVGWTQLSGAEPGENRIERLRLLGNGVVPQTAARAFEVLCRRAGILSDYE